MTITIEQLISHGISERVVALWRQSGIEALLPLQEEAVMRTGVLQNKSLIVFAPTSSGKTFIAELAALKHLEANRKVIYLVPTRRLQRRSIAGLGGFMPRWAIASLSPRGKDPMPMRRRWKGVLICLSPYMKR